MSVYASKTHLHWPRLNLWLVVVVGLAVALVALGSWVVIDRYSGSESDAATAVVDDLIAGVNARDGDAIASVYTADAVIEDGGGDRGAATQVFDEAGEIAVVMERVAPVTVEGDFAATYVRFTWRAGLERGVLPEGGTLLIIYQLRNGKIAREWQFLPGVTKPLENAKMPALGNTLTP